MTLSKAGAKKGVINLTLKSLEIFSDVEKAKNLT